MREHAGIIPGYLRVVGAATALWGLFGLTSLVETVLDTNTNAPGLMWARAGVLAVGGLGLLLGRQWGWPLALLEATVSLAVSIPLVARFHAASDVAAISLDITLMGLITVALFMPSSIAWLRWSSRDGERLQPP